MKVAIQRRCGIFCLSAAAVIKYYAKKGKPVYFATGDYDENNEFTIRRCTEEDLQEGNWTAYDCTDFPPDPTSLFLDHFYDSHNVSSSTRSPDIVC